MSLFMKKESLMQLPRQTAPEKGNTSQKLSQHIKPKIITLFLLKKFGVHLPLASESNRKNR